MSAYIFWPEIFLWLTRKTHDTSYFIRQSSRDFSTLTFQTHHFSRVYQNNTWPYTFHSWVEQGNSPALTTWSHSHIPIERHILHVNTFCKFKVNEIPVNHLLLCLTMPCGHSLGLCNPILRSIILTFVEYRHISTHRHSKLTKSGQFWTSTLVSFWETTLITYVFFVHQILYDPYTTRIFL